MRATKHRPTRGGADIGARKTNSRRCDAIPSNVGSLSPKKTDIETTNGGLAKWGGDTPGRASSGEPEVHWSRGECGWGKGRASGGAREAAPAQRRACGGSPKRRPRGAAENPAFAGNVVVRASASSKSSSRNLPAFSEVFRYLAARDGRSEGRFDGRTGLSAVSLHRGPRPRLPATRRWRLRARNARARSVLPGQTEGGPCPWQCRRARRSGRGWRRPSR